MLQTNETCENRLTESWNLTGFWNFSLPVGILCEIDDVANEWMTYDLIVNIIDIVSTYKNELEKLVTYKKRGISIQK